jgi:hypothetical protein
MYSIITIQVNKTKKGDIAMDEKLESKVDNSGGVAFCDLYGTKGGASFRIGLTARGATAQEALADLVKTLAPGQTLEAFIADTALSLVNSVKVSQPAPSAPKPAPVKPVSAKPAEPAQGGVIHVVKIDWVPVAVETGEPPKAKVSFLGNDKLKPVNKYPSLTWTAANAKLSAFFSELYDLPEETFDRAGYYEVDFMLHWVPSERLDKNGHPYHNVDRITKE